MLAPISVIHRNIWASLYLQFEAIIYRTRRLATDHENCLPCGSEPNVLSYLATAQRIGAGF